MMSSRERTLVAMRGGQPDRVPIQLFGTQGYTAELENYDDNFRRLLDYARQKADMVHSWTDPLEQCWAGMFSGIKIRKHQETKDKTTTKTLVIETPQGPLVQISQSDEQTVSNLKLKKHFIENEDDFNKAMSIPFEPFRPNLDSYFRLHKQLGDKGVVNMVLPSPIGVVSLFMKPEQFLLWTISKKDKIHALLAKIKSNMNAYFDYLIVNKAGELFTFGGAEEVTPPMGSPEHFNEYVCTYDKSIVNKIHSYGALVWLHCHGRVKSVIHQMCEVGYDILQPLEAPPMGDITMAEAKIATKGKCLIGNIQIAELYDSSPDKIDALCREVITQAKPGGGFILGITASYFSASMTDKILANYIAYIDAGQKYGKY
jgi:uroporphyrinogen-III decarboxylase